MLKFSYTATFTLHAIIHDTYMHAPELTLVAFHWKQPTILVFPANSHIV